MHTKAKTKALSQTQKPFRWGITSTEISFLKTSEVEAARDGSASDCSKISPLPLPKRKACDRGEGQR
jgi:hypothetical protein